MEESENNNPEQKKILRLYGALGATFIVMLIPSVGAALLSMLMIFGVLIATYVMRSESDEGSLMDNHMTFVIRTVWIAGFLGIITLGAGSAYLLMNHDPTTLNECVMQILDFGASMQDSASVMDLMDSCTSDYWAANKYVIMVSGAISAVPVLIYFVVRYARGLSRAIDGYRVNNPRGWF